MAIKKKLGVEIKIQQKKVKALANSYREISLSLAYSMENNKSGFFDSMNEELDKKKMKCYQKLREQQLILEGLELSFMKLNKRK